MSDDSLIVASTTVRRRQLTGCTISLVELEVLIRGGQHQRGMWIGVGVSALAGVAGIATAFLGSDWAASPIWVIAVVAALLVALIALTGAAAHGAWAAKADPAYVTTVERIRVELAGAAAVSTEEESPTIASRSGEEPRDAAPSQKITRESLQEQLASLTRELEERSKRRQKFIVSPPRQKKNTDDE